jgi:hypothetical protein
MTSIVPTVRWIAAQRPRSGWISRRQLHVNDMPRALIIIGLVLVVIGLLWPWLQKLGLGRLPGDLVIERDNFRLFFPITTCIIISVIVSILLWWFRK